METRGKTGNPSDGSNSRETLGARGHVGVHTVHDGGRSGDKPFRTQIGPVIPPADHAESGPRAPIKAQRGDDPAVENQYIGVMLTC